MEDIRNYMAELVGELYRCFDIINKEKYNDALPQPVITVQKTPRAMGHCSVHKIWANVETEEPQEDNDFYEMNIASNYLNRGPIEALHTMLHESVHLKSIAVDGKNDCTGKKHNKRFKKNAEAIGLQVGDNDPRVGYGHTSLTPELEQWIKDVVKPDPEKFKYFCYIAPKPEKEKVERKKFNTIYFCPNCDLEIKIEEALEDYDGFGTDIVCPCCGENFELKPKGKRGRKSKED